MSIAMRVFELSTDLDYRCLHLLEVIAGDDDSAWIDTNRFTGGDPIGSKWIPRKVVYFEESGQACEGECEGTLSPEDLSRLAGGSKGFGDFPHFWGMGFGVFTQRSFEALHELIRPFVEFLPLLGSGSQFTAFKVLHFVDALDRDKSKIEWYPQLKKDIGKPRHVERIKRYTLIEDRLVDEVIFRIPEQPRGVAPVFVTERFVDAVKQHELTGFKFTQVWPFVDPREQLMRKYQDKRGRRGKR